MRSSGAVSVWVQRWSHLVPPGGSVLDVACGGGRHTRWFADRGHRVTAVDRDVAATAGLQAVAEVVHADLEGAPWPLADRRFDAIVVTHYLWRPLAPVLVHRLAPGGVLLWETFADGNQALGRPSNPAFLLQDGELLAIARGLHVVAYEHGRLDDPARIVQRIAAVKPDRDAGPGSGAGVPAAPLVAPISPPGRAGG